MNMIFRVYFPCYLCKTISIAFIFHYQHYKNQDLKIIVNIEAKHYTYDGTDLHTDFKTLEIRNKIFVLNKFLHCITLFHNKILGFRMFPSAVKFFPEGGNQKLTFGLLTLSKQEFLHNASSSPSISIIDLSISWPT